MSRRVDIKSILRSPELRRDLMVGAILALQHREGVATTRKEAEIAYDNVRSGLSAPSIVVDGDNNGPRGVGEKKTSG